MDRLLIYLEHHFSKSLKNAATTRCQKQLNYLQYVMLLSFSS